MGVDRKHFDIAKRAARKIREYWLERYDIDKYDALKVDVRPITFELYSNMKNGYPPLKEA